MDQNINMMDIFSILSSFFLKLWVLVRHRVGFKGFFVYNGFVVIDLDKESEEIIDKILVIIKLQAFFIGIITVNIYFLHMNFFTFCLRGFFWTGFFVLFLQAAKQLLYSYWSFLFILTLYTMSFIIDIGLGNTSIGEVLALLVILGLSVFQMSIMMRPIYYPMPNWWEYDFRYRADIKGKVAVKKKSYNVRISDVRMDKASIQSFYEFEAGDHIVLTEVDEIDRPFGIAFDVATVRKNIVGRPYIVGLKLSGHKDILDYRKLKSLVHSKRLSKTKFIDYGQ